MVAPRRADRTQADEKQFQNKIAETRTLTICYFGLLGMARWIRAKSLIESKTRFKKSNEKHVSNYFRGDFL
jgi:hypothetical protein